MSSAIIRFKSTAGQAFAARLINLAGQQVGNDITDDFTEHAPGWYKWEANGAVPATFEGEVRIVRLSDGVVIRRVPMTGNVVSYPPPTHAHSTGDVSDLAGVLEGKVGTDDPRLTDARTPLAHTHQSITLADVYPIGCIYTTIINTNPATVFGFGTWAAFATGRVLVGVDTNQTEFNAVEKTGGSKTHTLTESEMPAHTHTQSAHNHTQDAHTHTQNAHGHTERAQGGTTGNTGGTHLMTSSATGGSLRNSAQSVVDATATNQAATATNQAATATNQNAGSGAAHNNLQPFLTVFFWKRTA